MHTLSFLIPKWETIRQYVKAMFYLWMGIVSMNWWDNQLYKETHTRRTHLSPNLRDFIEFNNPCLWGDKDIHRRQRNVNTQRQRFAIKRAGRWLKIDKTDHETKWRFNFHLLPHNICSYFRKHWMLNWFVLWVADATDFSIFFCFCALSCVFSSEDSYKTFGVLINTPETFTRNKEIESIHS